MKRGMLIISVVILLLAQYSAAGTISDYFNYFTNDAFSMITGLPFSPTPGEMQLGNIPTAQNEQQPAAKKATGASCTSDSQCKANVCTKSGGKGICGKKFNSPCPSNGYCYSGKCASGKCSKSKQGKTCFSTTECEPGLKCANNKCIPAKSDSNGAKALPKVGILQQRVLSSEEKKLSETESLELEINNKINKLNSKANSLLARHKVEDKKPTASLKQGKVNKFISSLTGRFLLSIPMPSVNLFEGTSPQPSTAKKANGQECTLNSQCTSSVCSAIGSKKYCGLPLNRECQSSPQCATLSCKKAPSNAKYGKCLQKSSSPAANSLVMRQQSSAPKPVAKKIVKQISPPNKATGASCQKSNECRSGLCKCKVGKCIAAANLADKEKAETAKEPKAEESSAAPTVPNVGLGSSPGLTGMPIIEQISSGSPQFSTPKTLSAASKQDEPQFTILKSSSTISSPEKLVDGSSCLRNEQCDSNVCACDPGKGKCEAFTPYVPQKPKQEQPAQQPRQPISPQVLPPKSPQENKEGQEALPPKQGPVIPPSAMGSPAEQAEEEPASDDAKYQGAKWECYDGTKGDVSGECKAGEELLKMARSACENKCNAETKKCGVNSYSMGSPCETAQDVEEPAAEIAEETPIEKKCDESSKKKLKGNSNKLRELKKKVCLEASKHRGIDYGEVVCSGVNA